MHEKTLPAPTSTGVRTAPTLQKAATSHRPTAAGPELASGPAVSADPGRSVIGDAGDRIEHRDRLRDTRSKNPIALVTAAALALGVTVVLYAILAY